MIWPFRPKPRDVDPEALRAFLRAGGVVRLREWLALDDATRGAFAEAGTAVAAERCLALAACLTGNAEAVAALADPDAVHECRLEQKLTAALNRRVPSE